MKRFVTWLWANDITTIWGVPNGTLSMMFTCCPNLMFLASLSLEIYRFSNWSFCWLWAVQSRYSFCQLWASQNWPYLYPFTDFGQVTVNLQSLGKTCWEKQFKPSQFDKKLFSMIQSARTKNWFSQSINRL